MKYELNFELQFTEGANESTVHDDANAIAALEVSIAHLMTPTELARQSIRTYNPYRLEDLRQLAPGVGNLYET
jgi:hypothetical protein